MPEDAPEPSKPAKRIFRKSYGVTRFDPGSAERQSKAALFAWKVFGGKESATAFLNNHDEKLGARPIDLAIASEAGLQAVMDEIVTRQYPPCS